MLYPMFSNVSIMYLNSGTVTRHWMIDKMVDRMTQDILTRETLKNNG